MAPVIIETSLLESAWLTGLGPSAARTLLDWEQSRADALLADVFGYHALQVGCPALDSLRANRMPHRWTAKTEFESPGQPLAMSRFAREGLGMDSRAWPWPAESLDLVVMPHALEQSADAHACLRELERVLIPEGQVFITGINPWSLWGWRQNRFVRQHRAGNPQCHMGQLLSSHRVCDWLRLLGFEVQALQFGGTVSEQPSELWRKSLAWLNRFDQRWWPLRGGAYLIVATKRVPGGRLLTSRPWRKVRSVASSTVPVARTDVGARQPGP
jgi:SAM-dependent methyltransferase